MNRMPYSSIAREVLPPRLSVLGYVKVGGIQDRVLFTKYGKPWTAPMRYTDPVRFEITTREQRIKEVKGKPGSRHANETFKVGLGYVRDERIHDIIGEAPSEIEVRFMFPRWQENFICHFGAHNGRKWLCQGNGIEAQDVERGHVPCTCPRLKQFSGVYQGPKPPEDQLVPCKPRGVLSFILPVAETFGGFHVLKTTSYESIANIRTQLELFESQFGRLDGLPFRLKVYPATKSYGEGEGTTTQPIVTLVIPASFETARQIAAAAAEESRRYLLVAGGAPDPDAMRSVLEREMVDEAEAEGREFHPDAANGNGDATHTKSGQASLEDLNERIRAKREGRPLPVVEVDAEPEEQQGDAGADYEVVAEGEPDEEDELAAEIRMLEELRDRAVAMRLGLSDEGIGSINDAIHSRSEKQIAAWTRTLERRFEQEPAEADAPAASLDEGPRGSLTGKTRDELNREYFALLSERAPELAESEGQRRLWQAQNVGKSSCTQWDPDDYELGISLIRKGRTTVEVPPRTEAPGRRSPQTRMPV